MRCAKHVATRPAMFVMVLAGGFAVVGSARGQDLSNTIQWKTAAPADDSAVGAIQAVGAPARQPRHVVVQLDKIPTPAERAAMEAAGITLLRYLGARAYFAKLAAQEGADAVAAAVGVTGSFEIRKNWKLHPMLANGDIPAHARFAAPAAAEGAEAGTVETIALYVVFHQDVNLEADGLAAVDRNGGVVRSVMRSINAAVVWIPLANLDALAAEDVVQWIEPPLPPLDVVNDSNRQLTQANLVQAAPYNLDGSGISVLVYDGGTAFAGHADFGGRLTVRDASGMDNHPTHVSATVGGDGTASGGQYRGMAPGVTIESYGFEMDGGLEPGFLYTDPGDLEADYNEAINTYGTVIANNSIGTNVAANGFPCSWEGDYGATSMLIDAIVRGSLGAPTRIIWANGNERGGFVCGVQYHTTAPPACAKNHITVGAVNSNDDSMTIFSSWGPTDDGRLKPDISAPGCQSNGDYGVTSASASGGYVTYCGTSMATPTVCGLSALILQDFKALRPGEPLPRNSTLKVLFAHNAVDLGNPGPDFQFGYGSVRVKNTIDFMRGGSFLEDSLGQGDEKVYFVYITEGASALKATLAWDDPPGAVNTVPELVNDLDLVAVAPNGTTLHYPWTLDPGNPSASAVRTQPDHLNNIEQVLVDNPTAGTWTIRVSGTSVPEAPQPFSIAVSPDMQTCSSAGTVLLNSDRYACTATATITVVDCDLDTDPEVAETVAITVSSTTEPAGESVLLTETSPASARFVGVISLSETNAAGVLEVSSGDTVTATYNDADDGMGSPAVVQDTADVDCMGPVITDVSGTATSARRAVVTFQTDEPACGTVRYGLACDALNDSVNGPCQETAHSINIAGLVSNTTYFFAVDAVDAAGNLSTDDNDANCYTFTTPNAPDDFFTQQFSQGNDLDGLSVMFTPDGSTNFYVACSESITSLPTNPAGGTTLPLFTDDSEYVVLSGATVSLFGVSYSDFYVGSNGYITFTAGDSEYSESLANHFDLPRISALFDDLNPYGHGLVSWKQLTDRVAVSWEDVPEYNGGNINTFQIEMFFDGRIRISWQRIDADDGLAGLSPGGGIPNDFVSSDLSAYIDCGSLATPPTVTPVSLTIPIDTTEDITLLASDEGLPDPPGALDVIVASLPDHGTLTDPGAGQITAVPYVLVGGGNVVTYAPDSGYAGADAFTFKADDGGTPPSGGESNEAAVSITIVDCRPAAPTDPVPPHGAIGVPVDTVLSWSDGSSTAGASTQTEGGVGTGGSGPTDVLALVAGADPVLLRSALLGYPDINSVDFFDGAAAAPTLVDLSAYDAVIVMSDDMWADAVTTGNVLADYVDAGGKVIQSWASFATGADWELAGRFVTSTGYEPFVHGAPEFLFSRLQLGSYDANHPIMDGVSTVSDFLTAWIGLKAGAVWVAEWDNGTPLVATQGDSVVGINVAAFDQGFYTGDVALLFHNAVIWLVESANPTSYDVYLGTDNPPATKIRSDLTEPNCDPGGLQTDATYYWQVVAKNACGEMPGPVWTFDTVTTGVHYHLTLTETAHNSGTVEINPEPDDANNMEFPDGTQVTLTAWPDPDKRLRHWEIYDPNFPDDANYATLDTNLSTIIVMSSDMHVHVAWTCAHGVEQVAPLLVVGAVLCGIAARRHRRQRPGGGA